MHGYCWETLDSLLDQFEGAVYILHIDRFLDNLTQLRKSFSTKYPNIGIGYSYKTNYLPRLCIEAHKQGLYAEVVSGMEYEIARSLKIPGSSIIFNGPSKSRHEVLRAINEEALINIDSLSEAQLIVDLLPELQKCARIGLRCNLDLQWQGRESRFGLSEASGELDAAFNLLTSSPGISIEGLHCHTSFDRSAESYGIRIKRLIEISDRLFTGRAPSFLDIGGGICGPMPDSLASQLAVSPPSYEDYSKAICEPLHARYGEEGPLLIIEPGVGLVGNVFDYVYRVDHVKKVGELWFAVTSGAAHQIKIVPNEINPPTTLFPNTSQRVDSEENLQIDLVGFTCLEHDVIYRSFKGNVQPGDILISGCTGAYSMVISPDFIRTTPAVVEMEEKHWKVLRDKVSSSTLLEHYHW